MNLEYLHKECAALKGFFKQGFERALEKLENKDSSKEEINWAHEVLDCISRDCNDLLDKEKFNKAIK